MAVTNYIERRKRDSEIVTACDGGEAYAVVGRKFGITGGRVADIYARACRIRAGRDGVPAYTREGLLGTKIK